MDVYLYSRIRWIYNIDKFRLMYYIDGFMWNYDGFRLMIWMDVCVFM